MQKYQAFKLGRRTDPYHESNRVHDGEIFPGLTVTAEVFNPDINFKFHSDKFIPVIGEAVVLNGNKMWSILRTSRIQDFYIHGDTENSKDKIVLGFKNAKLLDGVEFKDGDILLVTLNSLYLLKAVEG